MNSLPLPRGIPDRMVKKRKQIQTAAIYVRSSAFVCKFSFFISQIFNLWFNSLFHGLKFINFLRITFLPTATDKCFFLLIANRILWLSLRNRVQFRICRAFRLLASIYMRSLRVDINFLVRNKMNKHN